MQNASNTIQLGITKYNKLSYFIYFYLLFYFIAPHHFINIIFGYKDIKISDLVSLILLIFLISGKIDFKKYNWISTFFALCIYYLARSIYEIYENGFNSLIFSLKFFQYFIILICICTLNKNHINRIIPLIILFSLVCAILEFLGFPIGLYWAGRLSAQYGGPYEFSIIALLTLLYLSPKTFQKVIWLIVIFLTQTKASLFSLFLHYYENLSGIKKVFGLCLLLLTAIFLFKFDSRVYVFFSSFQLLFNDDSINGILNLFPDVKSSEEYFRIWDQREIFFSDSQEIDLSTGSRLYTYLLFFKTLSLGSIIFGNSAGYYGFALDSSILRLFGEGGLIAVLISFKFLLQIFSNFPKRNSIFFLLSLIAFSDIFFAARFIPFLALVHIYFKVNKSTNSNL